MKKTLLSLTISLLSLTAVAQTSVYSFSAIDNEGKTISLNEYRGKVLLIVNTATRCGFTPQYDGLEDLYQKYKERGLVIIGFPCDQFGHQEPGTDEQIEEFCRLNHGVTFPLMSKVEVNGENAHPIYKYLKDAAPGTLGKAVKWNFTKFLINRNGSQITRFAPATKPESLESRILELL